MIGVALELAGRRQVVFFRQDEINQLAPLRAPERVPPYAHAEPCHVGGDRHVAQRAQFAYELLDRLEGGLLMEGDVLPVEIVIFAQTLKKQRTVPLAETSHQ